MSASPGQATCEGITGQRGHAIAHGPCIVIEGYDYKNSKWIGIVFRPDQEEEAKALFYAVNGLCKSWVPAGKTKEYTKTMDYSRERHDALLTAWFDNFDTAE